MSRSLFIFITLWAGVFWAGTLWLAPLASAQDACPGPEGEECSPDGDPADDATGQDTADRATDQDAAEQGADVPDQDAPEQGADVPDPADTDPVEPDPVEPDPAGPPPRSSTQAFMRETVQAGVQAPEPAPEPAPIVGTHIDVGLTVAGAITLGLGIGTSVFIGVLANDVFFFIPLAGGLIHANLVDTSQAWGLGGGVFLIQASGLVLMVAGLAANHPNDPGAQAAASPVPELVGGPGEVGLGLRWRF